MSDNIDRYLNRLHDRTFGGTNYNFYRSRKFFQQWNLSIIIMVALLGVYIWHESVGFKIVETISTIFMILFFSITGIISLFSGLTNYFICKSKSYLIDSDLCIRSDSIAFFNPLLDNNESLVSLHYLLMIFSVSYVSYIMDWKYLMLAVFFRLIAHMCLTHSLIVYKRQRKYEIERGYGVYL